MPNVVEVSLLIALVLIVFAASVDRELERRSRDGERQQWERERASLLARQDALGAVPIDLKPDVPDTPFLRVGEDAEVASHEEDRLRGLLGGNGL
jgi:hypothetical protein